MEKEGRVFRSRRWDYLFTKEPFGQFVDQARFST